MIGKPNATISSWIFESRTLSADTFQFPVEPAAQRPDASFPDAVILGQCVVAGPRVGKRGRIEAELFDQMLDELLPRRQTDAYRQACAGEQNDAPLRNRADELAGNGVLQILYS